MSQIGSTSHPKICPSRLDQSSQNMSQIGSISHPKICPKSALSIVPKYVPNRLDQSSKYVPSQLDQSSPKCPKSARSIIPKYVPNQRDQSSENMSQISSIAILVHKRTLNSHFAASHPPDLTSTRKGWHLVL